jgi:hypothetical protein
MLCRLAVRRIVHPDGNLTEYVLRVAGAPTLGSAGTLGSDEKTFSEHQEVLSCLRSLGVSDRAIAQFEAAARQPPSALRFVGFADTEQIAFDRLQDAEFDIFID